jgi:hypothetical protein
MANRIVAQKTSNDAIPFGHRILLNFALLVRRRNRMGDRPVAPTGPLASSLERKCISESIDRVFQLCPDLPS